MITLYIFAPHDHCPLWMLGLGCLEILLELYGPIVWSMWREDRRIKSGRAGEEARAWFAEQERIKRGRNRA